jgi:multidrug resistance efflux pump
MKKMIFAILLGMLFSFTACSNDKNSEEVVTQISTEKSVSDSIEVFGEVVALDTKDIFIDFPAFVQKIYVKEGQSVKKGDKLINLNYDQYKNDIEKKSKEIELKNLEFQNSVINISAKEKELNRLKEERNEKASRLANNTDPDMQMLQLDLDKVMKDIQTAKEDYEKNKKLFDNGGISKKELETYEYTLDTKEKEKEDILKSMEKLKNNLKEGLKELDTLIDYKEAELAKAKGGNIIAIEQQRLGIEINELDMATMQNKLNKSYIKGNDIVSDIENGIISKISCTEGSVVGMGGASNLLSIVDADSIQVIADVSEEFIKDVKIEAECEITSYHDKSERIKGKVTKISDIAIKQNGEKIIKVYISIEENKNLLKPGFSVDVKILKKG